MLGSLPKKIAHFTSQESIDLSTQTTKKLESSELRYRRLFESAQDGILILDAFTGKITDANPFLKNLLGYTDSELLGKQLWQIGVFKDIIDSKKAFFELQSKGYIRYEDLPLHTKDDQIIDVEFVSNVYIVDTDKVIQCNIRDITDRKKAEAAVEIRTKELENLSKSQEETKKALLNVMEDLEAAKITIEIEKAKDEAMLASIGEGLIAVDNDKKIIVVNKSAEEMLGWKMKNVYGKSLTSFPLEDEAGQLIPTENRPINLAFNKGKATTHRTFFYVRKDKTRLPMAITMTPIKLGREKIGAIIMFRDITRERAVDQAKSEFVSLASHQLRTPLGISKWYLEALREEHYLDDLSEKAKDYLSEVYKSNERLLALVRELLSISRIDQEQVRDFPELINPTQLIKEVIKGMHILASKSNIIIQLNINKPRIPRIFIDPLRFQEMLENLIANAIVYSHPSGLVVVMVEQRKDLLLITIKDSGIGITKTDQKMLFTKFFRSAKATAKNTEGAGLGLYVVRSYIEGWGGTISVKSRDGKGSTFIIALPIQANNEKVKRK